MKKLFLILALIPLLGMGGGQSVITGRHRIPAAAATGHSFSTGTVMQNCTLDSSDANKDCTISSITSGDAVFVICNQNYGNTISVTSTPSAIALGVAHGNWQNIQAFVAVNITGGSYTATIVHTQYSGGVQCVFIPAGGVNNSTPFDVGANGGAGLGTSMSTGSVTTTNANDEVCSYWAPNYITSPTYTAGTGFTLVTSGTTNGAIAGYPGMQCKTAILTSTTTINPSLSWTPSGAVTAGTFAVMLQ